MMLGKVDRALEKKLKFNLILSFRLIELCFVVVNGVSKLHSFFMFWVEKMVKSRFLRFKDLDPGFSIMKTGSMIGNVCEWMIHCLQSIKKNKIGLALKLRCI